MVTKAIVDDIITPYLIKVRIPLIDGAENSRDGTLKENLSQATICSLSNTSNLVSIGDIVYVGFEDNDYAKPVIIGHLSKEANNNTFIDIDSRILKVNSIAKLPNETTIGSVLPVEVQRLCGVKDNIQSQINYMEQQLNTLKSHMQDSGLFDMSWVFVDGNTYHFSNKSVGLQTIDLSNIITNWQSGAQYEIMYHIDAYADSTAFIDVYTDLVSDISSTSRGIAISTNARSSGYTANTILNRYLYVSNRNSVSQQNTNILAYRRIK